MRASGKNIKTKQKTTKKISSKKQPKQIAVRKILSRKWIALPFIVLIAAIGTYFIAFSGASPSNCQNDQSVPICDVDQVLLANSTRSDSVLSVNSEAKNLGVPSQGIYFGAAFRAPTKAFKGSVPVYRVYNSSATYHDWLTDSDKATKEATYKDKVKVEGVHFYAWKTQVTGTVPVYRITRGGEITQSMFSTDKAWVDKTIEGGKNDPNGWKKDTIAPFIAFYAYPPNYAVPNQANPYDCSKEENFYTERCKEARDNFSKPVPATPKPVTPATPKPTTPATPATPAKPKPVTPGSVPIPPKPVTTYAECPRSLDAYVRGVNVEKKNFHQDCHKWWWTTAQNESVLQDFYRAINDCTARGWHYYDFKCNQYSKEALQWFAGIEASRVACLGRPGAQRWDPNTLACTDINPPAPNPSIPPAPIIPGPAKSPGTATPSGSRTYIYRCDATMYLAANPKATRIISGNIYSTAEGAYRNCKSWAERKKGFLYSKVKSIDTTRLQGPT